MPDVGLSWTRTVPSPSITTIFARADISPFRRVSNLDGTDVPDSISKNHSKSVGAKTLFGLYQNGSMRKVAGRR